MKGDYRSQSVGQAFVGWMVIWAMVCMHKMLQCGENYFHISYVIKMFKYFQCINMKCRDKSAGTILCGFAVSAYTQKKFLLYLKITVLKLNDSNMYTCSILLGK